MSLIKSTPPEWKAEGVEPSEETKTTGFTAGYKPPATYFNWFWFKTSSSLKELIDTLKARFVEGETLSTAKDTTAVANTGAEIFNDTRTRTYDANDNPFKGNVATGLYAHAEGEATTASGDYSHAEGRVTIASGYASHAEGRKNVASDYYAHAEGFETSATSSYSHSEGLGTTASGACSHAEGEKTKAIGGSSHSEGKETTAGGANAHSEGAYSTASGSTSHAEGYNCQASNSYAHAEGKDTIASGNASHAEGNGTEVRAYYGHAEGGFTTVLGFYSHGEGYSKNQAKAVLAEGGVELASDTDNETIKNAWSDAEKKFSLVKAGHSHGEGENCLALGSASHAEGKETIVEGDSAHSEGAYTRATGNYSHAEGYGTKATGQFSHAQGYESEAVGEYSSASGTKTTAYGKRSTASGYSSNLAKDKANLTNNSDILYINWQAEDFPYSLAKGENSYCGGQNSLALGNSSFVYGKNSVSLGDFSFATGEESEARGTNSHAEGYYVIAKGIDSHAEGKSTIAQGDNSHAEGSFGVALGYSSHAEGHSTGSESARNYTSTTSNDTIIADWKTAKFSLAKGTASHVEGQDCLALGNYSHAEGLKTTAVGSASHAEGRDTTASSECSHAEGGNTTALGGFSHAEGYSNNKANEDYTTETADSTIIDDWGLGTFSLAKGTASHVEGLNCLAIGDRSHAEGWATLASGGSSHAEGERTKATGVSSHAGGNDSTASGNYAFAHGRGVKANDFQAVFGINNIAYNGRKSEESMYESDDKTPGTIFIIGNGNYAGSKSNAFRVTADGTAYGRKAFQSSGADFAEYFEWADGNPDSEDRRGRFVTLDGEKIRLATSEDDYILGAVSTTGAFIGNSSSEDWQGKYMRDIFGDWLTQKIEIPEKVDEVTGEVTPAHTAVQYVLNPDYDPEQEYVSREYRKEWSPVGFHGQVVVVDDGTCEVNSYCKPSTDGVATASDTGYRVMARLDETHIKVLIR